MFDDGSAYERFMGRWSASVADRLLRTLDPPSHLTWLDVGCGSGALLGAAAAWSPRRRIGVDPSQAQLTQAAQRLGPDVELHQAGAEALPLADGAVDVAVTALALNFCPDPATGLAEMVRVTRPGGTVAGYVWDYDHPGFFLTEFWEAAVQAGGDERGRWPVCSLAGMNDLVALHDHAEVWPIDVPTPFASFDDLWDGFELGIGPAGAHLASLDEQDATALRAQLVGQVRRRGGAGALTARAIAFRVTVAT